jgi:hypothetical protein
MSYLLISVCFEAVSKAAGGFFGIVTAVSISASGTTSCANTAVAVAGLANPQTTSLKGLSLKKAVCRTCAQNEHSFTLLYSLVGAHFLSLSSASFRPHLYDDDYTYYTRAGIIRRPACADPRITRYTQGMTTYSARFISTDFQHAMPVRLYGRKYICNPNEHS